MQKNVQTKALLGKEVYLRPVNSNDVEECYNLLFESESRKLTGTKVLFTYDQVSSYLNNQATDSSSVLCFIVQQKNDEIMGDIALQDINASNRNASIRIFIAHNKHQGKGYGTEALNLMLNYGFGILNLHRIELNVFDFNERAIHVYQKVGFKVEGRQREALYYDHKYHDSILMSILEDEYRAKFGIL